MRTLRLGKTDLNVGELGFGALFASSLGPGVDESRRAVYRAIELGINLFDTAPSYANSEEVLGSILQGIKVRTIVSTKLGGRPQPFNPKDPTGLRQSVETSLKNLGRHFIDVLFIHEPDRPLQYDWWTDPESVTGPVLDVLDDLKRRGDVRFIGLGGTTCAEMSHLLRSDKFDVVLTAFNFSALFREATIEVLPAARERDMGVMLGSCLQQGGLGRRYDDVVRRKPMWMSKPRQEQFLAFYKLLDDSGISIVELCLRFAAGANVGPVLIGPKTAEQVETSVAAVEKGPLPSDVLARLDQIAAMVPFRPFEEPMILPLNQPDAYHGPGRANPGRGIPVGKV